MQVVESLPDHADPDTLIKEAWIDSKKITEHYSRLQVRLKLISLAIHCTYGLDVDVDDCENDEADEA